jgi:lipase maturation factor 1
MKSGPAVARLFHRLLALVFLSAWLSLGVQVHRLMGSRGLLPVQPFLDKAAEEGAGFFELPTWLWLAAGDTALTVGVCIGIVLSLLALAGLRPRLCVGLNTFLYLGYAVGARTFLSFQWDNLLLECGFFAMFLPRHRQARWVHLLFVLILFKLYWQSGVAKWQSHLGDWHDGSAMTWYYETAPLPTWGAWFAHGLPRGWHHLESWLTLAFEIGVPFAFFGPRWARLFSAAALTLFQIANALTANYGFFCYLATVLHVFLLDDSDVERMGAWLRKTLRRPRAHPHTELVDSTSRAHRLRVAGLMTLLGLFCVISMVEGLVHFTRAGGFLAALEPVRERYLPFRIINTYHLFGHITRKRIEPEFQILDGTTWAAHPLRWKAGDPQRRPRFVAPHQPRLDFQLWFYGLDYERATPAYVVNLLERLCKEPDAVQGFFLGPLPKQPEAVRLVFWEYHLTTWAEKRATGAWWRRDQLAETKPITCHRE